MDQAIDMPDKIASQFKMDSAPSAAATELARKLKLVGDAVGEMHITRKNMHIYPASHEQVQRSLKRAHDRIGLALSETTPLILSVMPEGLALGTQILDPKSSVFKDCAQNFKKLGIAAITFERNPEIAELGRFIQLMTADPSKVRERGGIMAEVPALEVSAITIQPIDYSRLQVTEESEIQRLAEPKHQESVWRHFISHMHIYSVQTGHEPNQGASPDCLPSEMAGLLNRSPADAQRALAYYQTLIADIAQKSSGSDAAPTGDTRDLTDFHRLVSELTPELQQQFLSAAFDQLAQQATADGTHQLMRGMDGGLIASMLRQANAHGKEISPSLLAFIKTMGHTTDSGTDAKPSPKAITSLLEREAYETYVDTGYDRLLKGLSTQTAEITLPDSLDQLQQELSTSLEEPSINSLVARALVELMTASQDVEEYRDWARQLAFLLDDLMADGAFGLLTKIWGGIAHQLQQSNQADRAKVAGLVFKRFHDPRFVAQAVAAIDASTHKSDDEAIEFVVRLGEAAIVEILDRMGAEECLNGRGAWFTILERNRPLAVEEAIERLKDPRPGHIRSMLWVVRRLGSDLQADCIKPLIDHQDVDVRMDALATLLAFNNPWGVLRLRDMLNGPWTPAAQQAMTLTGRYRVAEVVPMLSAWVERKGPLGTDIERREAALRTLNQIGDPQVIPLLTRLALRRGFFGGKYLLRLKKTLFETLDGYPYEPIKNLLHLGLKQKDGAIQGACRQLIKQHHTLTRTDPLGP